MDSILITGATGFIGSNIAEGLLKKGYKIYATYRTSSLFDRINFIRDKIEWVNTDETNWGKYIKAIKPDQLIHTAWNGLELKDRNNWDRQIGNFWFSKELFDLAKESGTKKIISFGSQAEYGKYGFPVNEKTAPQPDDAYGAVKTLTANYLRHLFYNTKSTWYWMRLFSVFGERENPTWLIPAVISALLKNDPLCLTPCEQVYNYMYIKDLVTQIVFIVQNNRNDSGIYNICNTKSIVLKELVLQLAALIGVSESLLKFGCIPYRPGQNMFISGDNSKFKKTFCFNEKDLLGLATGLKKTIEYYKKKA